MKTKSNSKSREALRKAYLQCFGIRATNATVLQDTVRGLMQQGVSRKTLMIWAVETGYAKKSVSSLLSRILCSIGLRERQMGAGRKHSPDALELLHHARSRYGLKYLKVLRATWRLGKSMSKSTIVAPQLQSPGNNCSATIRSRHKAAGRNGSHFDEERPNHLQKERRRFCIENQNPQ